MIEQKERFAFLDGFRAIGILMILGHHICVGFDLYNIFDNDSPTLTWVYNKSWQYFHVDLSSLYLFIERTIYNFKGILGVQIFFIISGFLITRNLLESARSWEGIRKFWIRRFLRIYPAYALMVVVSLLIFMWQSKFGLIEMAKTSLKYLFFLQNYHTRNVYLEHTWTLAIFEQFYIVCPLAIYGIYKIVKNRERHMWVLAGLFFVLLCVGAYARYSYIVLGKPLISWPIQTAYPYFTLIYHLGSLCLGCILAILYPAWRGMPKKKPIGYIFWVLGIMGYSFLFFAFDWGYYWGAWYFNIFGYLSTLSLFIAAYHGVAFITRFKVLQWLGRQTYGIYLWHILIFIFWIPWLAKLPKLVVILGALISAILVGILSTATVEKFFLKFRDRE